MHPAAAFQETDAARLEALVAETGLAVIIAVADGRAVVAHAPVRLALGKLGFHVSRANPLAGALAASPRALAVVNGPQSYVSPDWYGVPDQVPTWNYLSAEIEGPVRELGPVELAALLDRLSATFEARLAPKTAWSRDKLSAGRFEAMLQAIVGFEITVERLQGVRKLSQNKAAEAQLRLAKALEAAGGEDAQALARLIGETQAAAAR